MADISVFDLSAGNGPLSLAGYIQEAVNALDPAASEGGHLCSCCRMLLQLAPQHRVGDTIMIPELELFGRGKVEGILQLQKLGEIGACCSGRVQVSPSTRLPEACLAKVFKLVICFLSPSAAEVCRFKMSSTGIFDLLKRLFELFPRNPNCPGQTRCSML